MNPRLKRLLSRALPMNFADVDGGGSAGGSGPMSTDSFAEMLSGDGDNGQPETDPQSAEPEQDPAPETDPPEVDPEQDPEADSEADPEGQPETDPPAAFLELEINGEKVALTKDEAKNGYLRQQDYTQKAQRLAQERQQWDAHVAQQAAEVKQYAQEMGQLQSIDAALAEYQAVDWDALREENPQAYAVHKADYNDMRARRGDVERAIVQKQQTLQAGQRETFARQSQEAAAHMATVVPGFGKEHVAEMKAYGQQRGFSAEELANVGDKRMLEMLWKASQFDKQKTTTQQAIKKVSALPTKAAKAAPAAKPAAQLRLETQTRRLQQTGSLKDFAAALNMTS